MPHKQQSSRASGRSTKYNSKTLTMQLNKPTRLSPPEMDLAPPFIPAHDPSVPPNYDYSSDRGRKIRLRQEEQCVFNHSEAEKSPLLDVKQWREKLRLLRAIPKPETREVKRPRHKPHTGSSRTPRDRKAQKLPAAGLHRRTVVAIPAADDYDLDEDLVQFGDILDPQITADTRYSRYLEELVREGGADDLESLCNEHGDPITRTSQDHLNQQHVVGTRKLYTKLKPNNKLQLNDCDAAAEIVQLTELSAKVLPRRQVLSRSQSTDPVMTVSGSHGLLHDKQQAESRLSLNNFKLRLQLADDNELKHSALLKSGSVEFDPLRKHPTVMDSARKTKEGVKVAHYVTKTAFSPRRLSQSNGSGTLHEQLRLRHKALHIPASTTKNTRSSSKVALIVPATITKSGGAENKGGGWRMAHAKRGPLDYNRLIPVSIIGGARNMNELQ